MIKNVNIEEGIVIGVILTREPVTDMLQVSREADIQIGMTYKNGVFSIRTKSVDEQKDELISKVNQKAQWAFDKMDEKYKWTHERGVSQIIANELYKYKENNSAYTPVIEQYTTQKGRTDKEEQILKTERAVNFEVSAVIMIENLIGSIQDASTAEELEPIIQKIEAILSIEKIDDFMALVTNH